MSLAIDLAVLCEVEMAPMDVICIWLKWQAIYLTIVDEDRLYTAIE